MPGRQPARVRTAASSPPPGSWARSLSQPHGLLGQFGLSAAEAGRFDLCLGRQIGRSPRPQPPPSAAAHGACLIRGDPHGGPTPGQATRERAVPRQHPGGSPADESGLQARSSRRQPRSPHAELGRPPPQEVRGRSSNAMLNSSAIDREPPRWPFLSTAPAPRSPRARGSLLRHPRRLSPSSCSCPRSPRHDDRVSALPGVGEPQCVRF